jgi:two-component system, sporulation sensor kinase A
MMLSPQPQNSLVLDCLPDAYILVDGNGRITYLNIPAEQLLQRSRSSLEGEAVEAALPSLCEGTPFYSMLQDAMERKVTVRIEEYLITRYSQAELTASPFEEGLILHIRVKSQPEPKELDEEKLRCISLFEHHPDAAFSLDRSGNFTSVNSRFKAAYPKEVLNRSVYSLIEPHLVMKARHYFDRTLNGESLTTEWSYPTLDKQNLTLQVTSIPIVLGDQITGVYVIARDVTEQKLSEEALRRSEANLKLAFRIAKLGNWEWNKRDRKLLLTDEMYKILGLNPDCQTEEIYACANRIHADDSARFLESMDHALKGEPVRTRLRFHHPDGVMRYLEMMAELITDESMMTDRLIVTTRDITENVKHEEKLKHSEELYELISQNSQDAISLSHADGTVYYVSPGIRPLLGYEPEEIIGKKRAFFYHPMHEKNLIVPAGQDTLVSTSRCRHKDGRYIWLETSTKLIRDEQGAVIKQMGIGRDITQRMEAEELALKSEKLTLAGQLAAGIAHEIRNPLTAIKGFLQLMENGFPLRKEHVQVMSSELMRIEVILNELLLLAKPHEMKFYSQDMNLIVQQVFTLMETEAIMKNVVLTVCMAEDELWVDCDENQLKQVLINLIKNGMEAMPQGGELSVATACSGDMVTVSITDHGAGMPAEQLERIGQPFFTTKEKGTGLGLAVSYSIIENHKGTVSVKSELNVGTTFQVSLPYSV